VVLAISTKASSGANVGNKGIEGVRVVRVSRNDLVGGGRLLAGLRLHLCCWGRRGGLGCRRGAGGRRQGAGLRNRCEAGHGLERLQGQLGGHTKGWRERHNTDHRHCCLLHQHVSMQIPT
jgi:hypothetical protein